MDIPIEVYNKIMRFNSHPLADIIRPCSIESGFGRFMRVNNQICWLMTNSNKYIDNSYETYVLGKVLKHKYQVNTLVIMLSLTIYIIIQRETI
ncbi:MAG: hypothetical protein ACKPKO_28175 [Candidatus Fonsibacter sp.]